MELLLIIQLGKKWGCCTKIIGAAAFLHKNKSSTRKSERFIVKLTYEKIH